MRLRFKNLGPGLTEVVGTGLVIRRIDHPASGGGHWWSLGVSGECEEDGNDRRALMMDSSRDRLKKTLQRVHDGLRMDQAGAGMHRYVEREPGIIELVGTDFFLQRLEHEEPSLGHWWALTAELHDNDYECDQASLMNDVSLASMQHRVQRLYDAFGRLWAQ